jgi:hypothetical protein
VDDKGRCLCGKTNCSSPGKHPHGRYAPNGSKDATVDGDIIAQWFNGNEEINIGICAGERSGLVILDVDPKHRGDKTLSELEQKYGNLPQTPTVKTGGGGYHYYFKLEGQSARNSAGKIGSGLDIRGEGGYCVAPPSQHVSGQGYRWVIDVKAPLVDMPSWLLNGQRSRIESGTDLTPAAKIREGSRNDTLCKLAGAMRRQGCSFDTIVEALLKDNNARCDPPLSELEVSSIAKSVCNYEPAKEATCGRPILTNLGNVEPQTVEWFWYNRFPMGKLSLLVGNPGLGKSFLSLYIATKVTTGGAWPDSSALPANTNIAPKGSVVLLTAEDGLADTVRPRLDKMGADATKVVAIQGVCIGKNAQQYFNLTQHISALEKAIKTTIDVKLLIIDPISAYLGETDSHKNSEVRGVLAPLAKLAENHKVAVIAVSHLNKKTSGVAVYRVMGSLAFTAAARAVWLVTPDKNDEQNRRRLLTPCKTNLSKDPTGLAFTIEDEGVIFEPEALHITSDQALSEDKSQEKGALESAKEFVRLWLEDGPVPSKQVFSDAEGNGHSKSTLKRAIKELGVISKKSAFGGGWTMELPQEELPF